VSDGGTDLEQKVTNAANAATSAAGAASSWIDVFKGLWSVLASVLPALAISLFNYEETRVDRLRKENEALKTKLKETENKDAVDQKYSGMSDADIVRASITDVQSGSDNAADASIDADPFAKPKA
jgi:hypothetical protein